jgi:hypothetical protein
MLLISHRGNLSGPNIATENTPDQINFVLSKKLHCEIDVWYKQGKFYLGHDEPQYKVNVDFITRKKLWCHAKNIDALLQLKKLKTNCFFHNIDAATLTSKGYIWTFPGQQLTQYSIAVLPERTPNIDVKIAKGICTDYIYLYTK